MTGADARPAAAFFFFRRSEAGHGSLIQEENIQVLEAEGFRYHRCGTGLAGGGLGLQGV